MDRFENDLVGEFANASEYFCFDEVIAELNQQQKPEVIKEKPIELVELSKLAPEKRWHVDLTQELQGYILVFIDQLKFESPKEKELFRERLNKELSEKAQGERYTKLPEFGDATKEGFRKLQEYHTRISLPNAVFSLDSMQLSMVPGCPLKIAGANERVPMSNEQFRQSIRKGMAHLDINPEKLEDVMTLRKVTDWLDRTGKELHREHIDRLERFLTNGVEEGIKSGKYPEGWRRPEGMDKETWCSAVDQLIEKYTRTTRLIEAISHLERSNLGFKSQALSELPAEIRITRNENGRITKVDFATLKVQDLALYTDANRQKLSKLDVWCDKFEGTAQQAMRELAKEQTQIPGFGEVPVHGGFVNPATQEFVLGRDKAPGADGWVSFNLITYDLDVKEISDRFGKVSQVKISSDHAFKEVPWIGYLNLVAETKHSGKGNPVTYDADDWVAVQTGPDSVQMIQAKEVAAWKARQELYLYGGKAVIATMDAAMIASGTIELRAAAKIAEVGTKEAVALGSQVLKTEAIEQIPKQIVSRSIAKGAFEVTLGATGIFHNAGAHEIPWMNAISTLRSAYFLGSAGYSVLELVRLPKAAMVITEASSPALASGIRGAFAKLSGTEETLHAMEIAKVGALSKLTGWSTADNTARLAFAVSDKAFISMFAWDIAKMWAKSSERPDAVNRAAKALKDVRVGDTKTLERLINEGIKPSERTEDYFSRYRDTLAPLKPESEEAINGIIKRVRELSQDGVKPEQKQAYVQELVKYFRYDGEAIQRLQDAKSIREELSDKQITARAKGDSDFVDPAIRKVAGLAILCLSRKTDGSWEEKITSREVEVPSYTVYDVVDNESVSIQRDKRKIVQELTAAELAEILQRDFNGETGDGRRLEKAAALHETGLVPGVQLADMLLKRIENSTDSVARTEAVVDLAALISRMKVEDKVREATFSDDDKYKTKGLHATLSTNELLKRLEIAAERCEDSKVRSTALMSIALLRRETTDDLDKRRLVELFLREPQGVTEAELLAILKVDAASSPTDKASWERKLLSAEMLAMQEFASGKIDKTSLAAIKECMEGKAPPYIAVRALESFVHLRDGNNSMLDLLENAEPGKWKKQILTTGINLLGDIRDSAADENSLRFESIEARERLIPCLVQLALKTADKSLLSALNAQLRIACNKETEVAQEVRLEAIKGIIKLGLRDSETRNAVRQCLDFKNEPSPAVRLAAVQAVFPLFPLAKERKEIISSLVTTEPDTAVRVAMMKYYQPLGSILDSWSQRSEQAVVDAITEQNKRKVNDDKVKVWLEQNLPSLFYPVRGIFQHVDPAKEPVQTMRGPTTMQANWNEFVSWKNASSANVGYESLRKNGADRLVELELVAQNAAFKTYGRAVDALAARCSSVSRERTIRMGNKLVSDQDAALLSLGYLVRHGSQMGEPYYLHRSKDELDAGDSQHLKFTAQQEAIRQKYQDSKSNALRVFKEDPWLETEVKIAGKLRDLTTASKNTVNLKLLKEQLLLSLRSDASTHDDSRVILVDALDKLLSRPETDPEVKREIVVAVSKLVTVTDEVPHDKPRSMQAMLALLDKYAKRHDVFEQFSQEYAGVRTAIVSRSENDFGQPILRLKAHEIYDRQWHSVLSEQARLKPSNEPAFKRAEMLPVRPVFLEKKSKAEGVDEEVHDAVQRIILATKELPLTGQKDPRYTIIREVTNEKYHDRVRLAALLALSEAKDKTLKDFAGVELLSLALECPHRALRHDAVRILEGLSVNCSEDNLSGLRTVVAEKLAVVTGMQITELAEKSDEQLISLANEALKKRTSGSATEKVAASKLLLSMHRWGEGLAIIASQKQRENTPESPRQAEAIYHKSLGAFGVTQQVINKLEAASKTFSPRFDSCESDPQVREQADAIVNLLQETGSVQPLLSALTGYAALTADQVKQHHPSQSLIDRTIGVASLTSALSKNYYCEGTKGYAEMLMQVGKVYQRIASPNADARELCLDTARRYHLAARTEFSKIKESERTESARVWLEQSQQAFVQAKLEFFSARNARPGRGQREMIELSQELDAELAKCTDKTSFSFLNQRFSKAWVDTTALPSEQRAEAARSAERALDDLLSAASKLHGVQSHEYSYAVNRMWKYHLSKNEPGKAEAFFEKGLNAAITPDQNALRLVLLKQYYSFLQQIGKTEKSHEVAREFNRLNGAATTSP